MCEISFKCELTSGKRSNALFKPVHVLVQYVHAVDETAIRSESLFFLDAFERDEVADVDIRFEGQDVVGWVQIHHSDASSCGMEVTNVSGDVTRMTYGMIELPHAIAVGRFSTSCRTDDDLTISHETKRRVVRRTTDVTSINFA